MTKVVTITTLAIRALRAVQRAEREARLPRSRSLASTVPGSRSLIPGWAAERAILQEKQFAAIKAAEKELRRWIRFHEGLVYDPEGDGEATTKQ